MNRNKEISITMNLKEAAITIFTKGRELERNLEMTTLNIEIYIIEMDLADSPIIILQAEITIIEGNA
jgi:hypothetical protein